ncbi:hypothetical protein D3C87_1594940 [compost metagenome]
MLNHVFIAFMRAKRGIEITAQNIPHDNLCVWISGSDPRNLRFFDPAVGRAEQMCLRQFLAFAEILHVNPVLCFPAF